MITAAAGHSSDQALNAILAGYAAGTLNAPLHVLVASHLALAPQSRAFVRSLEAAVGAVLESMEPVPVSGRDAMLSTIFHAPEAAATMHGDAVLPGPLAQYLGRGLTEIRWRTLLPGVREFRVERSGRSEALLYWAEPGARLPSHTHEGSEYTLVLKGGFTDVLGHFSRGDVAIADQNVDHSPLADPDEDCFCFVVLDAPIRLTTQ